MSINALGSMIALLRADPDVAAAVGSIEVYGETLVAVTGDIDDEWGKHMPRRMVLVREAGGLAKTESGPLELAKLRRAVLREGSGRGVGRIAVEPRNLRPPVRTAKHGHEGGHGVGGGSGRGFVGVGGNHAQRRADSRS